MAKPIKMQVVKVEHEEQRDYATATLQGVRTIYHVERNGKLYLVHAPCAAMGDDWEIARLATMADGGRSWTWARVITSGAWAGVLAYVQSQIAAGAVDAPVVSKAPRVQSAVVEAEPVAVVEAEPVAVVEAEPVAVVEAEPVAVVEAEPQRSNLFEQLGAEGRDALGALLGFDVDTSARGSHILFRQRLREIACLPTGYTMADALAAYLKKLPGVNGARVAVTLEISDHFLRDVLCTAVEGGSDYWANFKVLERVQDGAYSRVRVFECDEDGGTVARFDVGTVELRRGLGVLLERGDCHADTKSTFLAAVLADDASDIDADCADALLQCTVFDGELRYG
jgi:hypothetical protein